MKDQQAGDQDHDAGMSMLRQSSADGIGVLLWQVLICLGHSTYTDDIDALSFSLNHLFRRVDFLYREALPGLGAATAPTITQEQDLSLQDTLIRRQRPSQYPNARGWLVVEYGRPTVGR